MLRRLSWNAASPPNSQADMGVHPIWVGIGVLVMGVALILTLLAWQAPAPKSELAPANEFSAVRALAVLERLLGDGAPHPIGSEANVQVGERIADELTALGYTVETQEAFACRTVWAECGYVTNILTRLEGQADGPAILLTAHYDSVAAGPGAADDMAGVAAILEIARILQNEPPLLHPVIFLLSDGEEPALLGAHAFVDGHPWAADIGVVVNLEASGTSGPSILFETTANNAWLIDAFTDRAPLPIANSVIDELFQFLPQNSDLTVYEGEGMPGVNFAFTEAHAHYHTPLDNLTNLDPGSVQHHGDNALAAVRAFDDRDLSNPPVGHAVYVDLLPGAILQWPASWTVWLALICVLVLLGVAMSLIRQRELSVRALLWGLLVLPLGILAAVLVGSALAFGVSAVTGAPLPWYANPLPMRIALWAGALLSMALVATAVARRAGFWALSLGVWLWWAILSLVVGWLAPGFSVLFLPPAALAALVLAVVGSTTLRFRPYVPEIAVVEALFGASWFWLPFALATEQTEGGTELAVMEAFAVGLAASALAPLLVLPVEYRRLRRWSLAAVALLMIFATGVSVFVPVYSADRPQRLNLIHVDDRTADETSWLADSRMSSATDIADVPASLREAGGFGDEPVPALPWSSRRYLAASAPDTGEPAPTIELGLDEFVGTGHVVELQLRSPRGADQLSLYVPEAANLRSIDVLDTPYTIRDFEIVDGYQAFHCYAPACDGITLRLQFDRHEPVDLIVADSTWGLPPDGDSLLEARPDTAVPSGLDADRTIIIDQVSLRGS